MCYRSPCLPSPPRPFPLPCDFFPSPLCLKSVAATPFVADVCPFPFSDTQLTLAIATPSPLLRKTWGGIPMTTFDHISSLIALAPHMHALHFLPRSCRGRSTAAPQLARCQPCPRSYLLPHYVSFLFPSFSFACSRLPRSHHKRGVLMNSSIKQALRSATAAISMVAIVASGCSQKETTAEKTESAPAKSKISVKPGPQGVIISTGKAQFTLAPDGGLTATLDQNGAASTLEAAATPNANAPVVTIAKRDYTGATLDLEHAKLREATGKLGKFGEQVEATGKVPGTDLEETVTVEVYDDFPGIAILSTRLTNTGQKDVALDSVTLQRHAFDASVTDSKLAPHDMWTFMGSSLEWGRDEIFQMPAKFTQENPFGSPVAVGGDLGSAGGGIPVVAFWTRNVGEAIGHIETIPLVIDIPVATAKDGKVEAGVKVPVKTTLKPNDVFSSPRTFLAIYNGDYYKPLSTWSDVVEKEGLTKTSNNNEDYAVAWCGWGYEFGVTTKQMLDTIPKLKELGIHWATLDDGWFNNYGDWQPRLPTFANNAIPDMVKQFHDQGIKVQLWWLPLAVEDGHYGYGGRKYVEADVIKQHPEWLILNKDGKPARMARNLATLCPAVPGVQEYYKQLTTRFIKDWGFDGSKLDNIYSVPQCYNPAHHHKSPNDSIYAMGDVYK